jgi:hypothetical protein
MGWLRCTTMQQECQEEQLTVRGQKTQGFGPWAPGGWPR